MAILFDILTQLRSAIADRNLSGLSDENIVIQKVPATRARDLPDIAYPCVLIAPWGAETLDPAAGSTSRDDIIYPVIVAIVAPDNADQANRFALYLGWRESIRKLFHDSRLPNGVTATVNGTSYTTGTLAFNLQVRPLEIVDIPMWLSNKFASALILRCFSREARG